MASKKAEAAGAIIISESPVDSLVIKEGKVVGIRSGNDEVYGDVVISAEGINRLVLERSGLAPKLEPQMVGVGVKEVIKLGGRKVINDRFNVDDDEGVAWAIAGFSTHYVPGGEHSYIPIRMQSRWAWSYI